jgi:protein-L-isoaspartate(D-aspartate) O-methyltransferase
MTLEECRRFYAEEIRLAANITSPALVDALAKVPREKFLGPAPWHLLNAELAAMSSMGIGQYGYVTTHEPRDLYHNLLVAIDPARKLNNGHPGTLACYINALDLAPGDHVFHLGCGVGYYTAIIAEAVGPSGTVIACEVDADLAERARQNLAGYSHVHVEAKDGAQVDPGECDAMLINAGVTHPHSLWLDRLRDGGRLVLPITFATPGAPTGSGVMVKIVRHSNHFSAQVVSFVAIYSSTSVRDPELEPVLTKAFTNRTLLKIKSVRRDQHEPVESCIVHGKSVCLSSAELGPPE